MSDVITLTGLTARGHHGVFDFERRDGQDFTVDVVLEVDLAPAARSDDVADTVHYGELAERLVQVISGDPVNLIETLAQRLADECLSDRRVRRATVTVHKPHAPIPHDFADVAVTVTRARAHVAGRITTALLSLGSNLGDRAANLQKAVERLKPVKISPVYRTPPWGDADQPDYLNAVVLAEGHRTPHGWLETARELERAAGRVRDPERRFGPRTLDVDIIAVWDDDGSPVTVDDPDLTVPHPRAHLRAFVLRPWLDLQPEADLPGHGRVDDLIRTAPVAADLPDVVRATDVSLTKTA